MGIYRVLKIKRIKVTVEKKTVQGERELHRCGKAD